MILQQHARRILAYSNRSCLLRRSYKTLQIHQVQHVHQVKPSYVRGLIKNLRDTNQFSKALEASEWMCKQRVFTIFPEDYAARLHRIETVLGLEEAEKFFESIPENMRDYSVYETLLRSYNRSEKTRDKAKATFEKMRDLGLLSKPSPLRSMIYVYDKLKKRDMVEKLQRKMKENNVEVDSLTKENVSFLNRYKRILYRVWNWYKEEGKENDDTYRSKISSLLKQDDVEGAEKFYGEWHPWGPELDMSIPDLLISRFREEGNELKVEEMVESIRKKRIEMHLRFLGECLSSLGVIIVILAFMAAIISLNLWLIKEYLNFEDPIYFLLLYCYLIIR